jgi:hypothetical protein
MNYVMVITIFALNYQHKVTISLIQKKCLMLSSNSLCSNVSYYHSGFWIDSWGHLLWFFCAFLHMFILMLEQSATAGYSYFYHTAFIIILTSIIKHFTYSLVTCHLETHTISVGAYMATTCSSFSRLILFT